MYHTIKQIIDKIDFNTISDQRKQILHELIDFIHVKRGKKEDVNLHFICTHNSRRSQFGQIWAKVAAANFDIPVTTFSGGIEVTEFNPRAIASLNRFGFRISHEGQYNPFYTVEFNAGDPAIQLFSKLVDDAVNPAENFAAIMTCSDADEKCPFVVGCEKRIALKYDDPKFYDDSPLEATFYDYRSFEIATEMFYVFSNVK